MNQTVNLGQIAVRLEGGIGDHILGMRLLHFIRRRYSDNPIVAYSDAGGAQAQIDLARMSPLVTEVKPVFQEAARVTMPTLGYLNNIEIESLREMRQSYRFFDAFTESLFIPYARELDASHLELLLTPPQLSVSVDATLRAKALLGAVHSQTYIGVSLNKYGPELLNACLSVVRSLLEPVMARSDAKLIVFRTERFTFSHWPEPDRARRESQQKPENEILALLERLFPGRVLWITDEPIAVVAATLALCRFFVGVDNGIKHLAWALRIPRTYVTPYRMLTHQWILRYAPDYNRILQVGGSANDLNTHIEYALSAIQGVR